MFCSRVSRLGGTAAPVPTFMSSRPSFISNLPKGSWLRVALILSALCLVKCGILFLLRKELFQIHWRIINEAPSWANHAAFYTFVALVGLNLMVFGRKCAAHGISALRSALVILGVFGTLFVVLTFHEGDKNYLSPVVNGILKWGDLWSYLSMNLFFRAPYLAAWFIGIALLYYGMVRTGRERYMPEAAAILSSAYLILNLRELGSYRAEMAALDALGAACLIFGARANRPLKWPFALAPIALMGVFFALFSGFDPGIGRPNPEFQILFLCSVVLFLGVTLIAWRRGILVAWSWLLPFASASFLLLITANFHLADNYRYLLLSGLTLPRYFLSEALFGGLLIFLVAAVQRYRPHFSLLWLDLLGFVAVTMAVIDLRLVQIMGVRLDWQVLAFGDSPKMMWRLAKPYLPMLLVALIVAVAGYWLLLRMIGKLISRVRASDAIESRAAFGGFCGLLLLGFAGLLALQADKAEGMVVSSLVNTSPWWKKLSQPMYSEDKFVQTARELGLESMLSAPPQEQRTPRDLNVVLIFQESAYNQHLSLFGCTNETQPLLSRYRDRMELFPNFFSNFAGSIHARFATFTGLYPVADFESFTKNHVPVKSMFEILDQHDYECPVFYSSYFDYTNFRDLLRSHGVRHMYDADTMPGERTSEPVSWGLKEEETLAAIQRQIREYSGSRQKFFLTYVPAAPHYPYDGTPQQFRKYKSDHPKDYTARYLNELLYMDWVLSSILDELETTGLLDQTLVVITSDHGEMLGGRNGEPIGHGWQITPPLANVPLIIMDPAHKLPQINPAVGSQVDLLPTLLDILHLPLPTDELYQGASLRRADANSERTVFINSFQQFATLRDGVIVCDDRDSVTGSRAAAYQVANQGSTPLFTAMPGEAGKLPDINTFDRFQQNFLRHYANYVQLRQRRLAAP